MTGTGGEAPAGAVDRATWARGMARYVPTAVLVSAGVLAVGWPLLDVGGRRSLLVAVGVVLAVQLISFGVLATRRTGSPGLLVAWGIGTLARFVVIGGAAFLLAGREGVDVAVGLLAMAGLFFVLLLMEPWALKGRDRKPTDG